MTTKFKKHMLTASAAGFTGLVSGVEACFAGNDFNDILDNIQESISDFPGLISGIAYMTGILLGVLGILKIKDHVENPQSAKLQDGAVRLAAGGALFALPIVYEAMRTTIGTDGAQVEAPPVNAIDFNVQ